MSTSQTPLRLWPGVAAALLLLTAWLIALIIPAASGSAMLTGLVGSMAILLWWVFFSRAPWLERLGAIVLMAAALAATSYVVHESIAGGGMGLLLYLLAIPVLGLALVAWAVATRRFAAGPRRVTLLATVVLACGLMMLIRTSGVRAGDFVLHWRWSETPEERLLADAGEESLHARARAAPPPVSTAAAEAAWPGFRGHGRDSIIAGLRLEADWTSAPPTELWRRPVGPGWSSFAVDGDRLYTQEQRGEDELVACYHARSGEPIWLHRDTARFWESNGGAGPRATPTIAEGRVYAVGATGIVNALDARDGSVIWSQNAATDAAKNVPYWGVAASPLVAGDLLIVAAAGRLVAYDRDTGAPRWLGPDGGVSYSSPHLLTIDGVSQVLLQHADGATSVALADGAPLWTHAWDGGAIVQPAMTAEGDVLISTNAMSGGNGIRRVAVARRTGSWTVEERWTSRGLKPYFNDFVVHAGHAFGFDGRILSCIDLADGTRRWKGGRYGNGQLVLLPDQDLLLVLSEDGELALVEAVPDRYSEVARFPAIEGKTWNHPVLVGDLLFVRNGEEMAAFRLALASR